MCSTCGCGQPDDEVKIALIGEKEIFTAVDGNHNLIMQRDHDHPHAHDHEHSHDHQHDHHHSVRTIIDVEENILSKNNLLAERNRGFMEARKITALNLVSSPGSGKTSLLEKTLGILMKKRSVSVIEGDQQTSLDAERIHATGSRVVQVNTGQGCHLDAQMINTALKKLEPQEGSFLFIENVGNLVCPALFDLGEAKRVVIISVTEGTDKPLKYPNMFGTSQLCIINKTDLLPYVDFDMAKAKEYALRVNHHLEFIEMSVKTGEGIDTWINWLEGHMVNG
jgi:hydrogenase nickel incorporation protein HypB